MNLKVIMKIKAVFLARIFIIKINSTKCPIIIIDSFFENYDRSAFVIILLLTLLTHEIIFSQRISNHKYYVIFPTYISPTYDCNMVKEIKYQLIKIQCCSIIRTVRLLQIIRIFRFQKYNWEQSLDLLFFPKDSCFSFVSSS